MSLALKLSSAKSQLKATTTKVTTADGQVFTEKDGVITLQDETTPGFVVDTTPDLNLSRILPWLYLGSQDVAADAQLLRSAVERPIIKVILKTFRKHQIKHILNVATGIEIIRDTDEIVEKKVELMDIPEHDIDQGDTQQIELINFERLYHDEDLNVSL